MHLRLTQVQATKKESMFFYLHIPINTNCRHFITLTSKTYLIIFKFVFNYLFDYFFSVLVAFLEFSFCKMEVYALWQFFNWDCRSYSSFGKASWIIDKIFISENLPIISFCHLSVNIFHSIFYYSMIINFELINIC